MPTVKVPTMSLNGGVSKRTSSKRLPQELENADNALLTVERSAEKRPPLTTVKTNAEGNYLSVDFINGDTPPEGVSLGASEYWNLDNLYFHHVDVDGLNRFCIVINRAAKALNHIVSVFKVTPTEWVKQDFDINSVDRGMREYLTHFNLQSDSTEAIDKIMGSLTFGASAIFYNKKKVIKFLPDNSNFYRAPDPDTPTYVEPHPGYIHSGSKFSYKIADSFFVSGSTGQCANGPTGTNCGPWHLPGADLEDKPFKVYGPADVDGLFTQYISAVASPDSGGGYKNVSDDIESRVNTATLEAYAVGHSVENFSKIDIPPKEGDMHSHAGWKAQAATFHLYHRNEGGIPNNEFTGSIKANANIVFLGLPTDQNYLEFKNTVDLDASGAGETYKYKFDTSITYDPDAKQFDANGNIVIGINGLSGSSVAGRKAIRDVFVNVIKRHQQDTKIGMKTEDKATASAIITITGTPTTAGTIALTSLNLDGTTTVKTFTAIASGTPSATQFLNTGTTSDIAGRLNTLILTSFAGALSSTVAGNVITVSQPIGGEAGNTAITLTSLANVTAPATFTGGTENADIEQDYGLLGNSLIYLKAGATDAVVTDSALTVPSAFAGGLDAPDYGYLTSPFHGVTGNDSIFSYPNANDQGKGEIWYTRDPYFTFPSGFYRTVSDPNGGQPYYQQVRTEDRYSVVDHRTMPISIYLDPKDSKWRAKYVPWKPRLSGSSISNPGPTAIGTEEKLGESIMAMEFWKGRLWIATDTTVFSSKSGDYFNFFLDDITNITDADPIDLTVNTGQFNLVQSLTSFQNFLFITTQSGTQFEIRGSASAGGLITPSTIELRPTSFYSTASTAHPVKMGSNIYFFDTEKLFLYSGSDAFGNEYSSAYELSQHIRGYLPEKFKTVSAIPSEDSIAMVDDNFKNHLYFYTQKVNSGKLVQSAFYRWIIEPGDQILDVHGYEGGLYLIVKRSCGPTTRLFVYYGTMQPVTLATPLLDRLTKIATEDIVYDAATNLTTVTVPFFDEAITEVVTTDDWNYDSTRQKAYSRYQVISNTHEVHDAHYLTKLTIGGNLAQQYTGALNGLQDRTLWVGRPYTMDLTLSQQHLRDQQGMSVPGVLNLKRLTTQHKNTGQYNIKITRYNRDTSSVRSEAMSFNDSTDLLGDIRIESEGELFSKVLGNADSTKIQITSDYPTPCNITSLEIIGTHKTGNTSIQK